LGQAAEKGKSRSAGLAQGLGSGIKRLGFQETSPAMSDKRAFVLTITCPDTVGIVAAVSGFLTQHDCFITEAAQYGDPLSRRFFMRIVFSAVEMAGEVIGLQMGLNFAGFFDPTTNQQTSAVGRFFGNTTMLLFVVINGHLMVLLAVISSFHTFPVGSGTLDAIAQMRIHELGAVVFRYGLWIALPMIGMMLFINIVLGFISRIAPQMNAFAIGFPLTLSAGLVGIAATLPLLEAPVVELLKIATDIFTGG